MSVGFSSCIGGAVWSPCSRFIAITWGEYWWAETVGILDAVTLGLLSTFPVYRSYLAKCLAFSPDTRLLTLFGGYGDRIISWDVQTGVLISDIPTVQLSQPDSHWSEITYSTCGTMVGLFKHTFSIITISTFNVLSGTHMYSHSVEAEAVRLAGVWAHGKCLRFAATEPETTATEQVGTQEPGTLTIWEVGFTSAHTLTKVKSLPIPHEFCGYNDCSLSYNPTLSWLISSGNNKTHVWDTKHSKYLLGPTESKVYTSSNSPFFIWGDSGADLWEESPTGCVLYQRFISNTSGYSPRISPNGELVFTKAGSVIQLWHTTDSNSPLSTISTHLSQRDRSSFLFRPSPDQALAAIVQKGGEVVTVLDLKSGIPQLIIDTGMNVYGLGMAGSTVIVVGYGKIVTWDLPAGGCVLNPRLTIDDSVKTTTYDQLKGRELGPSPLILVSPDLHHMVIKDSRQVDLYDVLTGQHLDCWSGSKVIGECVFTRDGNEVWNVMGTQQHCLKVLKNGRANTVELEHLDCAEAPIDAFTWQCPPGYQVTDDGWILCSGGKQLLWLPPHWWQYLHDRVWHGQFLALSNLPEILILDLE